MTINEIEHGPTTVFLPRGIDYPEALAELITEYDAAHDAWAAAQAELYEADDAIRLAEQHDAAAFAQTARGDGALDKGGRADKARKARDVLNIRVGDLRNAATAATEAVKRALTADGLGLLDQAFDGIDRAADAYAAALEEARETVDKAHQALTEAGEAVGVCRWALVGRGAPVPDLGVIADPPTWPTDPAAGLHGRVARWRAYLAEQIEVTQPGT